MDLTELAALSTGLTGAFGGFVLGLRVCGPRLQTTWTERHPVEIAQDVRAGRQKMRALHPHTQHLVARELQGLTTNRPEIAASVPLTLDGLSHRYQHLSTEEIGALSAERTPVHRRTSAPAGPLLRFVADLPNSGEVLDAEWLDESTSYQRAA